MKIRYISYNYTRHIVTKEMLHLVRLADGRGILLTTRQLKGA